MPALENTFLIFDFDGVIVDSENISLGELVNALNTFGVEITLEEARRHFLGVAIPTIEAYVDHHGNMPSRNGFRELWYDSLFSRFRTDLEIIDGFLELLDRLERIGTEYCIVSSGSFQRLKVALQAVGLTSRFKGKLFSADLVENGKPSPEVFQYAADKMKVEPKNCIVLEDSPAGVVGACAAGMIAYGFVGGSHLNNCREAHSKSLVAAGATDVIGEYSHLIDVLGLGEGTAGG